MVKGECFLTGAHSLGLSLLWHSLCARWRAVYLKSQKHRGWRQQRRKLLRWQIKPGAAVGFVRSLATLKCPLPGSVICHLSSAWSQGCSVGAAMNTNSFPSILMLYLPQKSQSCKNRQAAAAQCRKTWPALQQEQEPAWIFYFKKLLRIQCFEHDKIRFRQGNTFETFLKRKHFEVFVW